MRRSVHPLTVVCLIVFSFAVAIAGQIALQVGLLGALLLQCGIIRSRKKVWKRIAVYIFPVSCLLITINLYFGLSLHQGISYALRFALLTIPLLVAVQITSPADLSVGLRTMPIPPRFHYLFLFSFEIVRRLREVFHDVFIAQQLRGLRVEGNFIRRWKGIIPLLFPVTLIAISQSLDRSIMNEFKGIDSPSPKTYLRTLPISFVDRITIGVLVLASCAVIVSRIALR